MKTMLLYVFLMVSILIPLAQAETISAQCICMYMNGEENEFATEILEDFTQSLTFTGVPNSKKAPALDAFAEQCRAQVTKGRVIHIEPDQKHMVLAAACNPVFKLQDN